MSPAWVVALPVLGACLVLLAGARAAPALSVLAGLATWAAGLATSVPALGERAGEPVTLAAVPTGATPITLTLTVDGLAALLVLLATSVALAVLVYSVAYLAGDPRYRSYAFLVLVFTAAMCTVVLADDFFVLLVGWEVMGACSYFLIAHHWERREARAGAVKAFVLTRLGDVGLLFGIFAFGAAVGSFRISAVNDAAAAGDLSTVQATVAMLLVLCGVVGKSAQFPLHTWLPDAMPGPTPISALIHAATMVAAGVYLVARLFPVLQAAPVAQAVLAVIAAVSMLLAASFALAQDDLKRVLAWSTVSQLAYMFGALAVGAYAAGVFHLLSHGAFKALLFLCAGAVAHTVGSTSMAQMGGLRTRMPATRLTMGVGLAALVGLPPVVGFFSKDAVLGAVGDAALHGGSVTDWVLFVSAALTVLVTAAYATRAWLLVFYGAASPAAARAHEAPVLMRLPMLVLAALTVLGGLLLVRPGVLDPAGPDAELVHPAFALVSTAAVLFVFVLTYAEWWRAERGDPAATLGRRLRRLLVREAGVDLAYARLFATPTRWLARSAVAADRDVVSPYVRGSAAAARGAGTVLRWTQNGNTQLYLTGLVVGVTIIAVWVGVAAT